MRYDEQQQVLAELARISSDIRCWTDEIVGRIDVLAAAIGRVSTSPPRSPERRVEPPPPPAIPEARGPLPDRMNSRGPESVGISRRGMAIPCLILCGALAAIA